jgi:hypothetical protein
VGGETTRTNLGRRDSDSGSAKVGWPKQWVPVRILNRHLPNIRQDVSPRVNFTDLFTSPSFLIQLENATTGCGTETGDYKTTIMNSNAIFNRFIIARFSAARE